MVRPALMPLKLNRCSGTDRLLGAGGLAEGSTETAPEFSMFFKPFSRLEQEPHKRLFVAACAPSVGQHDSKL